MTYQARHSRESSELAEDFLKLPALLYGKKDIHQNYQEEQRILAGTHPLSHYFTTEVVVVYASGRPVGRALIIHYPQDQRCFLGYYECIDDAAAAKTLIDTITQRAAAIEGVTSILGPYNASFWLTYRLKIDQFDQKPYMSEPLARSYYSAQLLANNFIQAHTYVSNEYGFNYRKGEAAEFDMAAKRAKSLKYTIKSPKPSEFSATLGNAYDLFSALYTDFPGFKAITREDFLATFDDLQYVLNYTFVKFAYAGDELAGFAVAFPDYGNLLYRPMTLQNKLRIALRKRHARRYVITYLGVLPEHSGLGKALVRPLVVSAVLRGARVIGALALEDKVTASYAASMIKKQYHYALYERIL